VLVQTNDLEEKQKKLSKLNNGIDFHNDTEILVGLSSDL
jgi:hypothetical protein